MIINGKYKLYVHISKRLNFVVFVPIILNKCLVAQRTSSTYVVNEK